MITSINKTKHIFKARKKIAEVRKSQPDVLVTYKELFGCVHTPDKSVWEASVAAWPALVNMYLRDGASINMGILVDVLCPVRNSRKISNHEDVIQNYDEVFGVMRKAGLGGYTRSS